MQVMPVVTPQATTLPNALFVMVPVDQWNEMVHTLKHYERIVKLRRLSAEMDADPANQAIPWDTVKQELIERGMLEATDATATP